ncbi:MAG: family 16 glycosylhydrolase [Candidatus Marinimicrobia bacterium]|nr:family 16 glycosylhydrolase [Candidatus Neomarinimicrobiota bacterium]
MGRKWQIKFTLCLVCISLVYPKPYKGGELRTKESFLYGRFEVRFKSASGSGIVSSFFTYHDNVKDEMDWNEIDIEILGKYNNKVQFNTITPGRINHVELVTVNFDPSEDFHIYAIEWMPNYVAWYIDDISKHIQVGQHIAELNKPQKIMMNLWQSTDKNWVGQFDDSILPKYAVYDWVKYYEYDPENGDYGMGKNFKFKWKDDFDYFDSDRWQKATHTFYGNNCDFIPENVVFKDGYMILCLTTSEDVGYNRIKESNIKEIEFELLNVYPNPFNESLNIAVGVKSGGNFEISIFDLYGRIVNKMYNNYLCSGEYILRFDGKDRFGKRLNSGVYMIRVKSNNGIVKKKVTYLK